MIPKSINVDGQRAGHRHLVYVDKKIMMLTRMDTRLLAFMSIQRITTSDGWIGWHELYRQRIYLSKYLNRMKRHIHRQVPGLSNWPVFENGWEECGEYGLYRLVAAPETKIEINYAHVADLEYDDLNEKIRELGLDVNAKKPVE